MIFNGVFLVAVFALTIYGVFHGEDLESMMDAIRSADKRWLAPGLALVAFFIWGESIIIWYMMRSYGIKVKRKHAFFFHRWVFSSVVSHRLQVADSRCRHTT